MDDGKKVRRKEKGMGGEGETNVHSGLWRVKGRVKEKKKKKKKKVWVQHTQHLRYPRPRSVSSFVVPCATRCGLTQKSPHVEGRVRDGP